MMSRLTVHQLYVLKRLAEGACTKEIALERKRSVKAIEFHRAALYSVLAAVGVRRGSLVDLVHYAISESLVALRSFADPSLLSLEEAKSLCGLEPSLTLNTAKNYETALKAWRVKLLQALKNDDKTLVSQLKQCKTIFQEEHTSQILRENSSGNLLKNGRPVPGKVYVHLAVLDVPKRAASRVAA